jgi:hypothetical protein
MKRFFSNKYEDLVFTNYVFNIVLIGTGIYGLHYFFTIIL